MRIEKRQLLICGESTIAPNICALIKEIIITIVKRKDESRVFDIGRV